MSTSMIADADLRRLIGNELVGGKVMLDALEQRRRQIADLLRLAPDVIALEHRDDLVVGLAAIDDLQSPHHAGAQQHLGMIDRPLADYADVERIAIAALAVFGETPHPLAAIGLRDEAVERGRLRGGALRAVDAQVAGRLVDFVLHEIERGDLDIGVDDARRVRPGLQAVPGMRSPARVRARVRHAADCSVGLLFLRRRHG